MTATMATTWTLPDGSQVQVSASLTDAHASEVLGWLNATLPQQNDAHGAPLPRTAANLIKQWEDGQLAEACASANSYLTQQASANAAAAVVPIAPTIN